MHPFLIRILFISLTFLPILASCGRQYDHRLQLADNLMEIYPDSALRLLLSLPPEDIGSRADSALYALLITQAYVKNDMPVSSDSLIDMAVRYYEDKNDEDKLMRAYFYRGDIRHDSQSYALSMSDALKAYDIASEKGDPYWKAKCAELISYNFSSSHLHEEHLRYSKEAATNYEKAGKTLNMLYCQADKAIALGNMGDTERSLELLDSLCTIAKTEPADSGLWAYCCEAKFPILMQSGRYDEACKCADTLSSLVPFHRTSTNEISGLALLALDRKDYESAMHYIREADSITDNPTEQALVDYRYKDFYKGIGNYNKALEYCERILEEQNEAVGEILKQSAIAVQRDHLDKISAEEKDANDILRTSIFILLGVSVIICLLIWRIHISRQKIKDLKIERQMEELSQRDESLEKKDRQITELADAILEKDRIIDRKDNALIALYRNGWKTINMLSQELVEKGESDRLRATIVDRIEKELGKLRDKKRLDEIEQSVDRYENGIVSKLRSQCKGIRPDQIRLATLIYAGFDYKAVSLILDIRPKYFYNKRDRLIEFIRKSDAPDKDLFISNLK